jgi:hypothetical protein
MLVLSKYPIDGAQVRTFQLLRWSAMPGALRPVDPASGAFFHDDSVWSQLRLSSKSHWDVPVRTPGGVVHFLVSHPTPPVFDGPEDRNGNRNHDEIRLWSEYISPRDSGNKPAHNRSSDVLPAPFGPCSSTISPRCTVSDAPANAGKLPSTATTSTSATTG